MSGICVSIFAIRTNEYIKSEPARRCADTRSRTGAYRGSGSGQPHLSKRQTMSNHAMFLTDEMIAAIKVDRLESRGVPKPPDGTISEAVWY